MSRNSNARREYSKKLKEKLPERTLTPLNPVIYIGSTGLVTLLPETIRTEQVGWKAYGLSSVPSEWVPRFLVISADCFNDAEVERNLHSALKKGIFQASIKTSSVMLRSSGT